MLDLESGAGWDLVVALMQKEPRKRLSAEGALGGPLFGTSALARSLGAVLSRAGDVADQVQRKSAVAWRLLLGLGFV